MARPTPRSDEAARKAQKLYTKPMVPLAFAQKLERELCFIRNAANRAASARHTRWSSYTSRIEELEAEIAQRRAL